jgi:hypothetical protein
MNPRHQPTLVALLAALALLAGPTANTTPRRGSLGVTETIETHNPTATAFRCLWHLRNHRPVLHLHYSKGISRAPG